MVAYLVLFVLGLWVGVGLTVVMISLLTVGREADLRSRSTGFRSTRAPAPFELRGCPLSEIDQCRCPSYTR